MNMLKAPHWDLLRSFEAVVRTGSLSGAARALASTQPTIGRHIELLEQQLGTALFVRSRRGLTPTETALDLLPHAQAMAAASAALLRTASGEREDDRGTVRLAASEVVGGEILAPLLARFADDHPGIAIELVLDNRAEDLLKREADVAVRMFRPTQGALIARKIADVPVGLFAHRSYADHHGLPAILDDLRDHRMIGPDANQAQLAMLETLGLAVGRETFGVRTDSDLAQHALLRAGAGIGGMQRHLAGRDPDLVPVLADQLTLPLEMWLVMHEDLKASHRVRLLYDFLAPALRDTVRGR
jgi:DNA-binding transcriptional LysR family regulator